MDKMYNKYNTCDDEIYNRVPTTQGNQGKPEKKIYSGKPWKTQGKIWILPDLRENSGKNFF